LRLKFWIRFLSFFSNLPLSYLDDFVADIGKRAENCVGKSIENLVDSDGNWVDGFEQCTDMEAIVLAAQDQTGSKKSLDDFSIPGCMSWSKDCNWVWYRLHSYCQETSIELGKLDTPQISGLKHGNRCNSNLSLVLG